MKSLRMLRSTFAALLLCIFSLGASQAEIIRIRCSNDFFNVDTVRNTLERQGRTTSISWTYDGEWIRLTFASGAEKLAFSSKTGYVIQNGNQIDARCEFRNPEALANINVTPTANLRLAFIALPEDSRKVIQELMSLDKFYSSSVDGLWGSGTEAALMRYKTYVEDLTGQQYLIQSPFGAAQFLEAIMAFTYEGDECDGCENQASYQPSFNCAQASTLDERAICASPKLMELDNIVNAGFRQVTLNKGQNAAQIVARLHLERRKQCGSDQTCIEKVQRTAITRFIVLGAKINLPLSISSETKSASMQPEAAKPPPIVYIQKDEADYIFAAIKRFATENANELTVDFVINLDRLRQSLSGTWGPSKATAFESLLAEMGSGPLSAQRIASARSSFAEKQTIKKANASADLASKLSTLKSWVLINATSEHAPEIAQYLKQREEVSAKDDFEGILQASKRADDFLAVIAQKESVPLVAEGSETAKQPVEASASKALVRVAFTFMDQQETLGDAFDQYSAPKGQILVPVRFVFHPEAEETLLSPMQLSIEISTETDARYQINEPATLALAAQLGVPAPISKPVWLPGEPVTLVFEIPRINAIPKGVYVAGDGLEFKLKQE